MNKDVKAPRERVLAVKVSFVFSFCVQCLRGKRRVEESLI